ncbi:hypothetical protein [Lysobacter gummosus]
MIGQRPASISTCSQYAIVERRSAPLSGSTVVAMTGCPRSL